MREKEVASDERHQRDGNGQGVELAPLEPAALSPPRRFGQGLVTLRAAVDVADSCLALRSLQPAFGQAREFSREGVFPGSLPVSGASMLFSHRHSPLGY